ncbi:quinoprotein relay system zinc metallohydrolase 2 [Polaromonas sp.]|uniref:quinoprotein relay system zinc metallohydrolase 2 n=1 Tax=Polaromonas sp. TaxID=1869339 RepID=UPI0025F5E099|nr:quinoprotein relay system zinc metallohydrolase 2 [Polaromonas sp.]
MMKNHEFLSRSAKQYLLHGHRSHMKKKRGWRTRLFVKRVSKCVMRSVCFYMVFTVVNAVAAGALPVEEVAPGVFVHQGVHEEGLTSENIGAIANVGFIIGEKCVAVIDSGGSFAEGRLLREAIKKRTEAPICYVINTHGHPDHVYGNAAFTVDKPHFVGHRNLATSMTARHPYYFKYLERTLGLEHARESALVPPDVMVKSSQTIDLGKRKLTLRAWPTSHTDNDLTVFDQKSGTLWLGDLLFRERVPVVDGKLSGWLATMKGLGRIAAKRVVPGHGTVSSTWPAAMAPQGRYLRTLQVEVRAAVRAGHSIQQAVGEVGASERGQWQLFEAFHPRNVTVAFTEAEWEN